VTGSFLGDFGQRLLGHPPTTVSLTIGGKWLEIDNGQEPKPQQLFADAIPVLPGMVCGVSHTTSSANPGPTTSRVRDFARLGH
jgi:hypothetical protein